MNVTEGGANPRFNIMVMSGQLGGNVTLVYSTFNINATGNQYTCTSSAQQNMSIEMLGVVPKHTHSGYHHSRVG